MVQGKGLALEWEFELWPGDFMSQGRKIKFPPQSLILRCQRLWAGGSEIHCTSIRGQAQEQGERGDQEGLIPLFFSFWTG